VLAQNLELLDNAPQVTFTQIVQAVKSGVKIMDRIMVTDLLKQDGRVVGAIGFSLDSEDLYIFKAKATVVAAGNVFMCFTDADARG
jgi:succinate dehydrogenase/fumarate reductase flavoprotein subunit